MKGGDVADRQGKFWCLRSRKRTIGRFFFFFYNNNWLNHWILNVKFEVGWSEESDLTSDLLGSSWSRATYWFLFFIWPFSQFDEPYDVTNTVAVEGAHALGSFTSTDSASSKRHCLHDCLYCNATGSEYWEILRLYFFTRQRFGGQRRRVSSATLRAAPQVSSGGAALADAQEASQPDVQTSSAGSFQDTTRPLSSARYRSGFGKA